MTADDFDGIEYLKNKDNADFITKYDLKIYDYETKKYIHNEMISIQSYISSIINDFTSCYRTELSDMSVSMDTKLDTISKEISGIKTLLIEALLGMVASMFIVFLGIVVAVVWGGI